MEEYKLAVELIRDEGKLTWERFKLFFSINSALLAAIGFFRSAWPWWPLPITSLGIVMCIVWRMVSAKNAAYAEYWTRRANQLEPDLKFELLRKARWCRARNRADKEHYIPNMEIEANRTMRIVPCAFLIVWMVIGIICLFEIFRLLGPIRS